MSQPRIPDPATRERSVVKLHDLSQRMDQHIADLEWLNQRLETENQLRLQQVRQFAKQQYQ